jgi:flagellar biosynthesis activator protein FlaF
VNAFDRAKMAYSSPASPTRTLRGTEYDAFARITHRMKAAHAAGSLGFPALALALQDNRALWTVLAADVADDGNALPLTLRRQIFALANFVNKFTSRVLTGSAVADALIDINTAIMRGLRREGVEE